jgi:hypothetical protein
VISHDEDFVIAFNLTNPGLPQESPEISIKINEILTEWTILEKPNDRGRFHAPLQIAGYTSALLNQNTSSQTAVNTLKLQFTLQTNVPAETFIRISGMSSKCCALQR